MLSQSPPCAHMHSTSFSPKRNPVPLQRSLARRDRSRRTADRKHHEHLDAIRDPASQTRSNKTRQTHQITLKRNQVDSMFTPRPPLHKHTAMSPPSSQRTNTHTRPISVVARFTKRPLSPVITNPSTLPPPRPGMGRAKRARVKV